MGEKTYLMKAPIVVSRRDGETQKSHVRERHPALDISIVIPVYNSAGTLNSLLQRLSKTLTTVTQNYEIILVDDGSHDDSWAVIQALREGYSRHLIAIQLMRNYGQHNTLMCGLGVARGEYVVTMDDDLQNPPEEIPKLLSYIKQHNLDLVYGCPQHRNHAAWRNWGSSIVWHFYRTVFRYRVTPTPFRIMRHQLAQSVMFYDLNFTYLDGLLAWCTNRVASIEVEHHTRAQGRSNYSIGKLLVLALNLYTNFSLIPLQIVSGLGLLAAASGFFVGMYYLFQFFAASIAVPGFASTIIAILILGGVQLLALGVMGEYLGRLHLNVNRKPQYVIRNIDRSEKLAAMAVDIVRHQHASHV